MNVGKLAATVAAPKLEVAEQKVITLQPGGAVRGASGINGGAPATPPVAPVGGIPGTANTGQLIALNLHPAIPNGPIAVPPVSHRRICVAGPEGTADAPVTPDVKAGGMVGAEVEKVAAIFRRASRLEMRQERPTRVRGGRWRSETS